MKSILVILLSLFLVCTYSFSYAQEKTLIFAADPSYPPFEVYDPSTSSFTGYDIEIAEALCQQMAVNCEFIPVVAPDLLPGLNEGKYDAAMKALTISPVRQKLVSFTNPYYSSDGSFVALAAANLDLSPKKLANLSIGVQQTSVFENYLHSKYKDQVAIKPYVHLEEALEALSTGEINIVLGDTPLIKHWLAGESPGAYKIIATVAPDKNIVGDGYGIAVHKDNKKLLNALNKALDEIKKNGTYNKITQKYFGQTKQ
ncbi:arginine ABC transporter substrate-binding protein [soil metagenome]